MKFNVKQLNRFLLFKLPSAYLAGVRVKAIDTHEAVATVTYKWINQNPFRSIYWAVQGMASELATGILVMRAIAESGHKISMLVTHQTGTFTKKATGKIRFICKDEALIKETINTAITTKEGQILTLTAEGYDEQDDSVSIFTYQWSIKLKQPS